MENDAAKQGRWTKDVSEKAYAVAEQCFKENPNMTGKELAERLNEAGIQVSGSGGSSYASRVKDKLGIPKRVYRASEEVESSSPTPVTNPIEQACDSLPVREVTAGTLTSKQVYQSTVIKVPAVQNIFAFDAVVDDTTLEVLVEALRANIKLVMLQGKQAKVRLMVSMEEADA